MCKFFILIITYIKNCRLSLLSMVIFLLPLAILILTGYTVCFASTSETKDNASQLKQLSVQYRTCRASDFQLMQNETLLIGGAMETGIYAFFFDKIGERPCTLSHDIGFKIIGYPSSFSGEKIVHKEKIVYSKYKKEKCVTVKNEMYEQVAGLTPINSIANLTPSDSRIFHKGESAYIVMYWGDKIDFMSSFSISWPVLTLSKDHKIKNRKFLHETMYIPANFVANSTSGYTTAGLTYGTDVEVMGFCKVSHTSRFPIDFSLLKRKNYRSCDIEKFFIYYFRVLPKMFSQLL